jgi:hypothetical protein
MVHQVKTAEVHIFCIQSKRLQCLTFLLDGGCNAHPDQSLAYNGTIRMIRSLIKQHPALYSRLLVRRSLVNQLHESLCLRYFSPGSALYVYCILANSLPGSETHSNFNFTMDGIDAGTFLHIPDSSSDYQYNVPGELHRHVYPNAHFGGSLYTIRAD